MKRDYPMWLEPHVPVCQAIIGSLHQCVEVAVHDIRRDRLTRGQRLTLIRLMDERGLFATRHAAAHAARALGVSRNTIYALLKEART